MSDPQREAIASAADFLFFGGAAGGGKTDTVLGVALTEHQRSLVLRRESVQLRGVEDRLKEIVGDRGKWRGDIRTMRVGNRVIELGSVKDPSDVNKWQGRPHDFIGFDEVSHFLEQQFRFLCGWLRTTVKGQRCRVIAAGNPPTDAEGRWVVDFWSPWLDPKHSNPAKPGELRYYVTDAGTDIEVPSAEPVLIGGRMVNPKSRTFIPARVEDNEYLMRTGYADTLDALPEPLRSMMRHGDFSAGQEDDAWQVIPTAWVEAAQNRWDEDHRDAKLPMDSMGVDVARGGRDETIIACRHGRWFAPLRAYPGKATPDGPAAAALVVAHRRDAAPVHVDVIGVGTSVHDHLVGNAIQSVPINGAAESKMSDRSGQLKFANLRAELWWQMREALDPNTGDSLALPRDRALLADLCAPRWKLTARGILVEGKEDIIKRLGRSPDRGDAACYALRRTPKQGGAQMGKVISDYDLLGYR